MKGKKRIAGMLAAVMASSLCVNGQTVHAAGSTANKIPVEAGNVVIESMSGDDFENSGYFPVRDKVKITWKGFQPRSDESAQKQNYACICCVYLNEDETGVKRVAYDKKTSMKQVMEDEVSFENITIEDLFDRNFVASFSGSSMEPEVGNRYRELVYSIDYNRPVLNDVTIQYQTNECGAVAGATLHADASDRESGLSSLAYSFDGGTTWQASPDFTVNQNGNYTVMVRDKVHFISSKTVTVEGIDGTGPVITDITKKTPGGKNGFAKEVEISVTAFDALSGLAGEAYSFDGGRTFSGKNSTVVENNGKVSIVVKDGVGNCTAAETEVVEIDKTGPALSNVRIVPVDGVNGYGSKADVFFEVTDAGSGPAAYPISLDEGQSFTSKMEKRYTENGVYKVILKDALDNLSEASFQIRCIDKNAPVVRLQEQSESVSVNGFYKDVTVKVLASDEGVGLAQQPYSYDRGVTWTDISEIRMEKNGKVEVWVRDALMNTAKHELRVSDIDCENPMIKKVRKEILNPNGKFGTGAVITVDASDEVSGLADEAYSFDGGAAFVSENRISISQNGSVEIVVRDRAGNCARETVRVTEIDRTGPVLHKLKITPVDEQNGYGTRADISFEVSDAGIGLAKYPVSFDDGQSFTAKTEKSYASNGVYHILLRDALGNTTEESFEITCIDRQAPSVKLHRQTESVSVNGFYRNASVSVEASDTGCGLASKPYSFDRGVTWTENSDRKIERNGKVEIWVRDALMNTAKSELGITDIDAEGPVVGKIEKELLNQSGNYGTEMALTVHAMDAGGGLAKEPYSFDGGKNYTDLNVWNVKANGTVSLVIRDEFGNETCREIKVTEIDKTAPSGDISGNPKETVKKNVALTFTGRDAESGISALWYQSDRVKIRHLIGMYDGEKTVKEKVTITANGNYRFIVRDMVGNEAEYTANVTKINKEGAGDSSGSGDSNGGNGSNGSGGSNGGSGSGGSDGSNGSNNGDTVIIGDSMPSDEDGASSGNHIIYPSERVELNEKKERNTTADRMKTGGKTRVVKLSGNEADEESGASDKESKSGKEDDNFTERDRDKTSKETIESLLKENMAESEAVVGETGDETVYPDIVGETGVDGKKIAAVALGIILFLCAAAFGLFWYMGMIPLGKKKDGEEEQES